MKKPYAESTLKRKYRETGISPEKIEEAQRYLDACASFYKFIEMKNVWKVIGKKCSVTKAEMSKLLPIFERDDGLFFYVMREDDLYRDGTEELVLIDRDYMSVPSEEFTDADANAWIEMGEDYEGPPMYEEDIEIIHALAEECAEKQLYIPADILLYADPEYMEETPQVAALRQFLEQEVKLDLKKAGASSEAVRESGKTKKSVVDAAILGFRDLICDVRIQGGQMYSSAVEAMEETGFLLRGEKQLQRFFDLFADMSNNTRMPSNRGFTPLEMRRFSNSSTPPTISFGPGMQKMIRERRVDGDELKRMIDAEEHLPKSMRENLAQEVDRTLAPGEEKWVGGTLIKGAKIRPNDLCPCGSGKKYKKCCGRNMQ